LDSFFKALRFDRLELCGVRVSREEHGGVDNDKESDRFLALRDRLWRFRDYLGEAGVLLNPIGQGPRQKRYDPMTLDLFLMADLVLVEAKVVLEFPEGLFNAPAQEISLNGVFSG
jgi:hypothetical protein